MGLEANFNYIGDFDAANPIGSSDRKREGDNHLRGIKSGILGTFPAFTGTTASPASVTLTEAQINDCCRQSEIATITAVWQIQETFEFEVAPELDHDVPLEGKTGGGATVDLIQCGGSDILILGEDGGSTLAGCVYYAGTGFHQFYNDGTEIVRMGPRNAGTMLIKDRDNAALKTVGYRCPTRTIISATSYTLDQNDEGRVLVFTGSSAVVTCPRNLDDDELGFTCTLINKSGGDITVNPTSPATMELLLGGSVDTGGFTLQDNSVVQVYNGATDVWEAWGNGAS